jgi:predicted N-acetyltransferase YhbS
MLDSKLVEISDLGVYALFCFKDGDRTPVGHMIIDQTLFSESIALIRYVHVVKEFRSQGIGNSLMSKVKDKFSTIFVERIPDSEMENFYVKHGFRKLSNNKMIWEKENSENKNRTKAPRIPKS